MIILIIQLGKLGWACSCWAVWISFNLLCLWCTFLSGFLAQFRCRSSSIRLGPASWWPPAMGGIVSWPSLSLQSLLLAISLGWGGNDAFVMLCPSPPSHFCIQKPSRNPNVLQWAGTLEKGRGGTAAWFPGLHCSSKGLYPGNPLPLAWDKHSQLVLRKTKIL